MHLLRYSWQGCCATHLFDRRPHNHIYAELHGRGFGCALLEVVPYAEAVSILQNCLLQTSLVTRLSLVMIFDVFRWLRWLLYTNIGWRSAQQKRKWKYANDLHHSMQFQVILRHSQLCPRCKEVKHEANYQEHVSKKTCKFAVAPHLAQRCPICHDDIPVGDEVCAIGLTVG